MKRTHITFSIAVGLSLFLLIVFWWNASPVSAGPDVQVTFTPRPKLSPTPAPPPGFTPTPIPPGSAPEPTSRKKSVPQPPRLHGSVLDWGKGNVPGGVKVVLRGNGWEIPVRTDESGEYRFQNIGNEVAFLNAIVPEDRGELRPLTTDLPVRVRVDGRLIVNMAFYPEGTVPDALIGIEAAVSSPEAESGSNVSYIVTVTNRWDQWVSEVIVADYLPAGLAYIEATASQGNVVFDRGLVWASLGSLAPGSSATVTIVASVDPEVEPGTMILNRVAAYHSENVAVQAEVSITVTEGTDHVLPVTGAGLLLPLAGILLAGVLLGARRLRHVQR